MTPPRRYQSGVKRRHYRAREDGVAGLVRGMVVRVIAADGEDQGAIATPPQPLCDVLLAAQGAGRAYPRRRPL